MPRRSHLNSIRNNINILQDFVNENIFRENLGTQSLINFDGPFADFVDRIQEIIDNEEQDISLKVIQNLDRITNELVIIFQRIKAFSDVEFVNKRAGTLNDISNFFDEFKDVWQNVGWMFIKNNSENLLEGEFQKAQQANAKLQTDLSDIQTLKSSLEQQISEFKDRYKDINTNVEIENQVNIFGVQAKKNKTDSQKWLVGIIISGALLILILIIIYCNLDLPAKAASKYFDYNTICDSCGQQAFWVDMIRYLFFKLLILSTNIYILSFCVKNYNACMHNKTNNDQRHNSFAAALHFYNTTTSEKREEILIKVADAIFTYQKSGYYGKDSEPSNPSIIQGVIEKVGGKG